jgi:hypothetical protein
MHYVLEICSIQCYEVHTYVNPLDALYYYYYFKVLLTLHVRPCCVAFNK